MFSVEFRPAIMSNIKYVDNMSLVLHKLIFGCKNN